MYISTTPEALLSPARQPSNAVLPSTLLISPEHISHILLDSSASIASLVMLMSAVAEEYASKQPLRPQLQGLPP